MTVLRWRVCQRLYPRRVLIPLLAPQSHPPAGIEKQESPRKLSPDIPLEHCKLLPQITPLYSGKRGQEAFPRDSGAVLVPVLGGYGTHAEAAVALSSWCANCRNKGLTY